MTLTRVFRFPYFPWILSGRGWAPGPDSPSSGENGRSNPVLRPSADIPSISYYSVPVLLYHRGRGGPLSWMTLCDTSPPRLNIYTDIPYVAGGHYLSAGTGRPARVLFISFQLPPVPTQLYMHIFMLSVTGKH